MSGTGAKPRGGTEKRSARRPVRQRLGLEEPTALTREARRSTRTRSVSPRRCSSSSCFGAIYLLLPKLVGVEDGIEKLERGRSGLDRDRVRLQRLDVLLLRRPVSRSGRRRRINLRWRESYQITMAGLAATRLFSAGGAGGIVLTYWALRKAGMEPRQSASRMVAFLVLLYAVYMLTLIIDGILLRTGVLLGPEPAWPDGGPGGDRRGGDHRLLADRADPEDFERRHRPAASARLSSHPAPPGDRAGDPRHRHPDRDRLY